MPIVMYRCLQFQGLGLIASTSHVRVLRRGAYSRGRRRRHSHAHDPRLAVTRRSQPQPQAQARFDRLRQRRGRLHGCWGVSADLEYIAAPRRVCLA